ncbi:E3 ubiquitin-protein ligase MARCHF8-like [Pectinophora gossypiella]|uniref:E3 ubiquitin-protein ligase MARCHF8-like n=1 Tax=Pectinophora gossypiella TaxID=13191 RepID=UPI00214F029F|nr:E3 ubiquitin-protein ligase MARCHF8-like [Pectinophora gossypiella]
MDNKENQDTNAEEATKEENQEAEAKNNVDKKTVIPLPEDAGPSRTENLPGSVCSPKVHRAGLSKSEHSIAQIITRQDVANALKLTSLSFGTSNPPVKNINFKDLKIPSIDKNDDASKVDSATMMDLKRFMATCFKFNKEGPNITTVPEVPVCAINTVVNEIQEIPNSSCITANAQTDDPTLLKQTTPNEPKISKAGADKKKTSGSLSERSDLGLTTRDSLSSIGSNVCRICMTRGRERLISPCNCKGSLANVHLSCLERWLNQVGRNHCELCGFSYPAIRTPRYTVLQALRLWFGNPRNRSHLQSDCLIFWLLSTVTAGLLAVCIVGTQYFVIEGNKFGKPELPRKEEGISHRITETAMDFFMAVVLCGYSVTVYLLWKDHYVMWNRWRRANVNVRLLLSPDSNPVPFVPRPRYNVV